MSTAARGKRASWGRSTYLRLCLRCGWCFWLRFSARSGSPSSRSTCLRRSNRRRSSCWASIARPSSCPWSGCPAGSSRAKPDFNGSQPLATRFEAPCPFRSRRAIRVRQIDGPQGIGSHSIGPVRTQNRNTLSDFIRLLAAAVHALRPDDLQNGRGNYSGLVKFTSLNLTGIAADQFPTVDRERRFFQQDRTRCVFPSAGPTVYWRDFGHAPRLFAFHASSAAACLIFASPSAVRRAQFHATSSVVIKSRSTYSASSSFACAFG